LFWSDEDQCWIADISDLKFCSAHAETPDEALREVQVAKKAWLTSAKAHKRRIPKPTYRPAIYE
jgi:predicted RNase H-like HicB family nuclease